MIDVRSEVDKAQCPEEESAFLFNFLCQFGNSCHFARFQHIPVLKTLYHCLLQGGHGFRIKFCLFCLRLTDDRFAAIIFQPDGDFVLIPGLKPTGIVNKSAPFSIILPVVASATYHRIYFGFVTENLSVNVL